MAEERRGTPVEKWDEVNGIKPTQRTGPKDPSPEAVARNQGERFQAIREMTGMNRMDFAEYLNIPYRTMTEWEHNRRTMPEYVFSLIEFKVQTEFGLKPEQTKDPNALGNQMRGIEDMVEQNDNCFDGIINNLPKPEDVPEKADGARESVLKKLKDCVKILEEEKDRRPRNLCFDRELC